MALSFPGSMMAEGANLRVCHSSTSNFALIAIITGTQLFFDPGVLLSGEGNAFLTMAIVCLLRTEWC